MKDPKTGYGRNPIYFYDDEIAECSCPDCKPYKMCWPREMFGAGAPDNLRGCGMWTLTCTKWNKQKDRRNDIEWYTFLRWRSLMSQEGNKLPPIQRYKTTKETRANNILFNESFLPLFSGLEKDEEGYYICPVLGIRMELEDYVEGACNQRWSSPSVDRIDSTKEHHIDNIQIISWRANNLKSNASLDELRQLGAWAEQLC